MYEVEGALQHLVMSMFAANKRNISLVQGVCLVILYTHTLGLPCCPALPQPGSVHTTQGHIMQGAEVSFTVQAGQGASVPSDAQLQVYTTRPDTLFGVTYMVVAPEHPLLSQLTTPAQQQEVDAYVKNAGGMSELERTELQKSKTGIFTGQAFDH